MNKKEYELRSIRNYYYFPYDNYLLKILKDFANGHGSGMEGSACYFSTETMEGEEDYLADGVCYYFERNGKNPEDLIISYDKFYGYLLYAVEKYLMRCPENKEMVEELLDRIKKQFPISSDVTPINYDIDI